MSKSPKASVAPIRLTNKQIKELKDAFALFDVDGNGMISTKELGDVLKSMGVNPTRAELMDMISEVDTDQNGEIDFDEFCLMMAKRMVSETEDEEIVKAFKMFDRRGVGFITADDFRTVMTSLGDKLSEDEAEAIIHEADRNGDGIIDYEEFVLMMKNQM